MTEYIRGAVSVAAFVVVFLLVVALLVRYWPGLDYYLAKPEDSRDD